MTRGAAAALAAALALVAPAVGAAERSRVYSIRGADCGSCGEQLEAALRELAGVRKVSFDKHKVELTVRLDDGVADEAVLAAVKAAGLEAVVGAGRGAYLPVDAYPPGADVAYLTRDGSAVGPLERLRVPGKYTAFDVYADWCGPCRAVDARLREIVAARSDVAVRKLNLVDFDSALARELGPRLDALPYVVVFTPEGKRRDVAGADLAKLDEALGRR